MTTSTAVEMKPMTTAVVLVDLQKIIGGMNMIPTEITRNLQRMTILVMVVAMELHLVGYFS